MSEKFIHYSEITQDDKLFIIQTLRNAADVFEDITNRNMTPQTLEKAAECCRWVLHSDLDDVLAYVTGMRGGGFKDKPNEMVGDLDRELKGAIADFFNNAHISAKNETKYL